MRKVELLPTRDGKAGYGPELNTVNTKIRIIMLIIISFCSGLSIVSHIVTYVDVFSTAAYKEICIMTITFLIVCLQFSIA